MQGVWNFIGNVSQFHNLGGTIIVTKYHSRRQILTYAKRFFETVQKEKRNTCVRVRECADKNDSHFSSVIFRK